MKSLPLILIALVLLGSPVWISVLIALLRRPALGAVSWLCALQVVLAFLVWWFFWGGGIGGEANLSDSLQLGFIWTLLPLAVAVFRFCRRDAERGASPGGNPAAPAGNSRTTEGPPSVS